jgi:hypothetical protein
LQRFQAIASAANEDQVRQAIEEILNLMPLLGFRTYPQQARTVMQFVCGSRSARHDGSGRCNFFVRQS